jgi:FkbM family methyltransferase
MKLYQNTVAGLRYRKWTRAEAIAYFVKGVARELRIFPSFFLRYHEKIANRSIKKRWLKRNDECVYFDFNGAKLPNISDSSEKMNALRSVFNDVFLIPCFYGDNYNKNLMKCLDDYMGDGPYGYIDGVFNVTVQKNDVVIDAGAWIGDFSAYAASKGTTVYAFEPVKETFQWLCKTRDLNNVNGMGGVILPIQKGLGDIERNMNISVNSMGSSIVIRQDDSITEQIPVTTLDRFVEENKLEQVDFIKADIEGAERDMLRGATNVLKTFAPKLAICTYHLADDPFVLEQIIKEANPDYTVVHLRHKLFACIVR